VLLANPSFGAKSVKDLIAIARTPGKNVAYGSGGVGNSTHLVAEMFSQAAGVKMTHVAYKGVAPAINAVLGGEVQTMFIPPTIAVAHIKGGKVRALGFTGKSRWSVLPDVPTMAESGLPGFSKDSGWNAWLAPKGTPPAILRTLQQAAHAAVNSPKISKILDAGGYDPFAIPPAEARKFLQSEIEIYSRIVKAVGIKPQ
jgi:tripartite-type tricarboxylate transporter receptor subunit TctC